jgi:hypothetical protein
MCIFISAFFLSALVVFGGGLCGSVAACIFRSVFALRGGFMRCAVVS